MRLYLPFFLLLLAVFSPALAAVHFPVLTGRVVDEAHILSPNDISNLEQNLAQHEKETSNQLVVVTVSSLQGVEIEEYGYQLGRNWGIGQKGKNNGVLLIVAPNDRKVRIEVGYGLEGTLTDAISSQIIQTIILPKFRSKDFVGGIKDGAVAIISVLEGKTPANIAKNPEEPPFLIKLLIVVFIIVFILVLIFGKRGGGGFGGWRSGGGGFRGGGGGFGGGGSSGRW
jgi:uncharacterized protein